MFNKAVNGFTWLFAVRILSRLVDFILNVLVLRDIDPGTYGLTTNLGLLTTFSLFYLKQCLKQAYQRNTVVNENSIQSAVNMMMQGVLITLLLTPVIGVIVSYGQSQEFILAAVLFGIAAILEGICEPFIVPLVMEFKYAKVARAESIAVFLKTIILYLLINKIHPIVAFGVSQIVFGLIEFIIVYDRNIKYKKVLNKHVLEEMSSNRYQFTLMALMKVLLQELEKIVMLLFNDPVISGEYQLVSHIGAYVPRFIYAPLEEVSFNLFPKLTQQEQLNYLNKTLKLLNLIGITIILAGIPCASAFLLLYGKQWQQQSCIQALQLFCFYEWTMGINGITEAMINSTIQTQHMSWYRYALIAQTFFYFFFLVLLISLGSSGIILANILSMLLRISISYYLIVRNHDLRFFRTLPRFLPLYILGLGLQLYVSDIKLLVLTAGYYGLLGLINFWFIKQEETKSALRL